MGLFYFVLSLDQKGPFWVVYVGIQPGSYDSWPKAAMQVNKVPHSSHKKFATFFEAFDSFTAYCIFKSEMVSHKPQLDTITDEEVDMVVDEFTALWLAPAPTNLPLPWTLLRQENRNLDLFNEIVVRIVYVL